MPARDALDRIGLDAAPARAQGRARADQRHAGEHRACARCAVQGRARVRGRHRRRRAVGRCAQGLAPSRSTRASRRFAASRARSASPPQSTTCSRAAKSSSAMSQCGRVQDPYSFRCQPQVMGAALDLLENAARTLTIEAGAVTDNPIVFADEDTRDLRRQFPRPAGRLRRRHDRHGAVRGRLDLGAARQRPRRSEDERPSRVPDPGFGRQFGPDDPAGHRRRAGQREQEPRFPGERRFDPDLGRPGGSCVDGADRRAQGGADRPQRRGRDRGRADGRRRGHRLSRAAQDLAQAAGRSTRRCARVRRISPPTAIGRTKWRRFRRPCSGRRDRRRSLVSPCSA